MDFSICDAYNNCYLQTLKSSLAHHSISKSAMTYYLGKPVHVLLKVVENNASFQMAIRASVAPAQLQ